MTWIQLANAIMSMPDEVLHQQARVWLPEGNYPNAEEFPIITSVGGFDSDRPIDEENFPSLDLDRGGQWF